MKTHTTNYCNTFIEIAEDCPASTAEIPPVKDGNKTVANIQYELLSHNPYKFTSDEVLFQCFAEKNDIAPGDLEKAREQFFSKGQPCFRSSPLTKRYGWGVHSNAEGKVAVFGMHTAEYEKLVADKNLKVVKAMRSKRA